MARKRKLIRKIIYSLLMLLLPAVLPSLLGAAPSEAARPSGLCEPDGPTLVTQDTFPSMIQGIVRDETGSPVPSALVQAFRAGGSEVVLSAETDERGYYALRPLPPGTFVVQVTLAGFQTATQEVSVRSGHFKNADFMEMALAKPEVVEAPSLMDVLEETTASANPRAAAEAVDPAGGGGAAASPEVIVRTDAHLPEWKAMVRMAVPYIVEDEVEEALPQPATPVLDFPELKAFSVVAPTFDMAPAPGPFFDPAPAPAPAFDVAMARTSSPVRVTLPSREGELEVLRGLAVEPVATQPAAPNSAAPIPAAGPETRVPELSHTKVDDDRFWSLIRASRARSARKQNQVSMSIRFPTPPVIVVAQKGNER